LFRREAGGCGKRLELAREVLPGQVAAGPERRKQPLRLEARTDFRKDGSVIGDGAPRGLVHRHQPFLVPFSPPEEDPAVSLSSRSRQRDELLNLQSGGVETSE